MTGDKIPQRKISVCQPYLGGREMEYVTEALKDGWISSSGKYVTAFEEEFAKYCGVCHGIAACNGTVAIHLALVALGIKSGDEVIIPSFTMIATAAAVVYTGAKPVFVDADPLTWNIDVNKIEEKLTSKTKAIMPVSIFGNPCQMDEIRLLARKHGLSVIEDGAESHGAEYKGKKVGSLSDITAFSFFANKNLTTGEGGMVVTDDENLAQKCRYFKNLCFPLMGPRNYVHEDIGFNYRMSNLHAAIGLAQVEKADEYRKMRMHNADLYKQFLADVPGIVFQKDTQDSKNVHWMNSILLDPKKIGRNRDQLIEYLRSKGIESRRLFVGMHHQPCLSKAGCDVSGQYPVTENLTENGLYLPSASNLLEEDIRYICEQILGGLHV
ncbi:MAG: DegT/DnrJ/EryC1/StrS family aminotransferase [Candidatus Omnitrophica bacterium]|nr:DegT/DnrJ/EryC1/StrS family aminotransferase [Candidatus Omnitrophota bacterium]